MRLIIIGFLLILYPLTVGANGTAFEDIIAGKKCKEREYYQSLDCKYKVGKDLEFSIDGIGTPDTGITFFRTKGLEGDYYATFGLMHGYIIIKHGKASNLFGKDFAFVSPKNGQVYKIWGDCKAAY